MLVYNAGEFAFPTILTGIVPVYSYLDIYYIRIKREGTKYLEKILIIVIKDKVLRKILGIIIIILRY